MNMEMLLGIVLALVVLNSHPIYSKYSPTQDNIDEDDPSNGNDGYAKQNGISFFEMLLENLPSNSNQTKPYSAGKCINDFMEIRASLKNRSINALKMIDAWGKIPSGLLTGNLYEFGSFDECFEVQIERQKSDGFIQPQYCLTQLSVLPEKPAMLLQLSSIREVHRLDNFNLLPRLAFIQPENVSVPFNLGICIPASCPPRFVEGVLNRFLSGILPSLDLSIDVSPEWCQLDKKPTGFTTLDIVTTAIIAVVLLLVIMSTAYDIVCTLNKKKKHEVLTIFSAYTNGQKIFSMKRSNSPDVIDCLHGIRALTMVYVVLGHAFFMHTVFPTKNKTVIRTWVLDYSSTFISAAPLIVETFFVLSGFLVTLVMLKNLEKSKGRFNIFAIYFHRYIRLTPLLAMTILFETSVLKFFGDGPIWAPSADKSRAICERDWWKLLLYVHNHGDSPIICVQHAWYLSVDMQLFLFAPFITYGLYRFGLKCLSIVILAIFGSLGGAVYAYFYYGDAAICDNTENIYHPTYIRMLTWLLGVVLGYIIYRTRNKRIHIPRVVNVLGWMTALGFILAAILSIYPLSQEENPSILDEALYNIFSRLLWALGLCYIIFACIHGFGGPVNWFLSLEFWLPLSRLSFAMYLVHFEVMVIINGSMREPPFFSNFFVIHKFFGYFVLSFFGGIVASLAFESPIVAMEKLMSRSKGHSKTSENNNVDRSNIECHGLGQSPIAIYGSNSE